MADRGDCQFATGWGSGGSGSDAYYAMNGAPEGWYHKTNSTFSWSPELRLKKTAVQSALGVSASKIMKGQSIADISGTATSDANASGSHILSGKTAYVNGSKITGNIASMSGGTYTPSASSQTISCSGKYMTGNITINAMSGVNSFYSDAALQQLNRNQTRQFNNLYDQRNKLYQRSYFRRRWGWVRRAKKFFIQFGDWQRLREFRAFRL